MNNKEIILKLKEDLKAIGFTVTMSKYYELTRWDTLKSNNEKLLARYRNNEELFVSYDEGINLIRVAVSKGLYLETYTDFTNILEDILGPLSHINWGTYRTIFADRDIQLGQPVESYKYLTYIVIKNALNNSQKTKRKRSPVKQKVKKKNQIKNKK
jgi:hypothetical protein